MNPRTEVLAAELRFELPEELSATEPAEARGLARDQVRLMVVRGDEAPAHHRFHDLPDRLDPGDVLVVNTSATLPAAVPARRPGGRAVEVHVGAELDDGRWVIELRRLDAQGPHRDVRPGEVLAAPGGLTLAVRDSHPLPGRDGARLWVAEPSPRQPLARYLARHGRPVRYGYLRQRRPLAAYRTVFADQPGSAEMPSASRPFTPELVVRLAVRGVVLVPLVLHCGLSSADAGEPPAPERFAVPAATADVVNAARAAGRRVVAAGTTVVRALESAAAPDGTVTAARGWTDLVIDRRRPVRVVTGLVTGWHAPEASHLSMLEAVAGPGPVRTAYREALAERYLWHEFGDTALFLR